MRACPRGESANAKRVIRSVRPHTLSGEKAVFDDTAPPHHRSSPNSRYLMSPRKWIALGAVLFAAALGVLVVLVVRVLI